MTPFARLLNDSTIHELVLLLRNGRLIEPTSRLPDNGRGSLASDLFIRFLAYFLEVRLWDSSPEMTTVGLLQSFFKGFNYTHYENLKPKARFLLIIIELIHLKKLTYR